MAKRCRVGNAGIYRAALMYLACTHVFLRLAAIRAMAASVSTSQTLELKQSKGYAPRIIAGCMNTTSNEDEQGTVPNETAAPQACRITAYICTDAVTPRTGTSCHEGQAVHRDSIAGLVGAATRQGVSTVQVATVFDMCADTFAQVTVNDEDPRPGPGCGGRRRGGRAGRRGVLAGLLQPGLSQTPAGPGGGRRVVRRRRESTARAMELGMHIQLRCLLYA